MLFAYIYNIILFKDGYHYYYNGFEIDLMVDYFWRGGSPMCISLEEIRTVTGQIAKEYNINKIYLFGSYARGEETDSSDIDMLISSDTLDILSMSRLKQQLTDVFDTEVDVVSDTSVSDVFRFLIKDDEILIYEKS